MQKLLTLNAGSSSIKFAIYDVAGGLDETPSIRGNLSGLDEEPALSAAGPGLGGDAVSITPQDVTDHATARDFLVRWLDTILNGDDLVGVGHRIVHGGPDFSAPILLNDNLVLALAALTPLAPGHQPHNLAGVAAISKWRPLAPQVACFDTAFHRTQARIEEIFAIPQRYAEDGLIRYGFHGLSYEYIAGALGEALRDVPKKRVIVAHLGAGASMCAMIDGRSVATTMGFTALDGLPMATRSGAIDPGLVLHLIQEKRMTPADVAQCLYEQSGLLGLSGVSGDMRRLESSDAPEAREAIAYFIRRAVREIGSLAAAMGGVDALIFTAGIGEKASRIREGIVSGSSWLGFALDKDANRKGDARITKADSTPSAWVIPTDEERMIARHTMRLTADQAITLRRELFSCSFLL